MRRQRILERVGWTFWRCFGSNYTLDRDGVLDDLFQTLDRMGIAPVGMVSSSAEYTEHRVIRASGEEARSGQESGAVGVVTTQKQMSLTACNWTRMQACWPVTVSSFAISAMRARDRNVTS